MVKNSSNRQHFKNGIKSNHEICDDHNRSDNRKGISRKGKWILAEDICLINYVKNNGPQNWKIIASDLKRTAKSCRLRWFNQLSPDIIMKPFCAKEDEVIIDMVNKIGTKWSRIAKVLKGRTDNQIKNRYNSSLKKIHGQRVPKQLPKRKTSRTVRRKAKPAQGNMNGSPPSWPISTPFPLPIISTSSGSIDLVPPASTSIGLPCPATDSIDFYLTLDSVAQCPTPGYEAPGVNVMDPGLFTDPCTFYPAQVQQCAPIGEFTAMIMEAIGSVDEEPHCESRLAESSLYTYYPAHAQQCAPIGKFTAMMMEAIGSEDEESLSGSGS